MGGGGTTTQASQSTSVNQIPQWMTDAGEQNYAFAQNVAEQPLQQYQGQMVSDVAPQTQQSWDVAANSGNVGADQYNGATAGYLGALGQTPANVRAGQISNTNLQPYMDPYTQSVINATMPGMIQANALSQNQQANAANSAKAFGGSRQGIQQGVAQAQGAQNVGLMLANLNNQNFTQAQAAATGDINRTMAAQQGNQTAAQNKITSDIAASQGLANTGDSMNKANVANYGILSSAGAGQSMQAQNEINAQMAKFSQAFNYPQQQLGTLLSALGMTPHDTSTSSQQTQQTTTPTDWASLISGGIKDASSIYGMMGSDRRMKKDITPVGTGPAGIPVYKYRFKGAPAGSPKVQGPMAQDVQKVVPQAVSQIPGSGGKLQIHMPTLEAATEGKPRGYATGTSFVQPPLATFIPPSSPGVAKGIGAMSAFRPPMKLPRGATIPVMPKHFARGAAQVPGIGPMDSVPAMLTPGEAVLTPRAANHLGRHNIAALNAFLPPVGSGQATTMPRAGARGMKGALANTKLRPKIVGGLRVADERPQYQHGTGTIGGLSFHWGSGMPGKYWSVPYGDYPVTPDAPTGDWAHRVGAIPIANNVIPDSQLGRNRIGIMIHSGSASSLDALYTQGCFKVAPSEWPAVRQEILKEASNGPLYLHVQPGGVASFTNASTLQPAGSIPTAGSSAPAVSSQPANLQNRGTSSQAPIASQQGGNAGHEQFIRDYAAKVGVNPDVAVGVANAEGLRAWSASNPNAGSYVDRSGGQPFSFGDFQLNTRNGMGVDALKAGIDPRDPNQWQAADQFAIDQMKAGGLGPWKGDKFAANYKGSVLGTSLASTPPGVVDPSIVAHGGTSPPLDASGGTAVAAAPAAPSFGELDSEGRRRRRDQGRADQADDDGRHDGQVAAGEGRRRHWQHESDGPEAGARDSRNAASHAGAGSGSGSGPSCAAIVLDDFGQCGATAFVEFGALRRECRLDPARRDDFEPDWIRVWLIRRIHT